MKSDSSPGKAIDVLGEFSSESYIVCSVSETYASYRFIVTDLYYSFYHSVSLRGPQVLYIEHVPPPDVLAVSDFLVVLRLEWTVTEVVEHVDVNHQDNHVHRGQSNKKKVFS